jgi:DNA-binding IclR family transcriptional regulator
MPTNKILVLEKALSILSHFYTNSELSVKEIEILTGINRTTVFKSLHSFIDWGYLEQDPVSKRYRASLKILGMSGTVLRRMNVVEIARPYLLTLRDETGETAALAVLNGFDILIADWESSFYDAHINSYVGKKIPAYCSGAGKAILANLSEEEITGLLKNHELNRCTHNTITNSEQLLKELKRTLNRGYGISIEEFGTDVIAVAAPIFDINNKVVASIASDSLKARIKNNSQIEKIGKAVMRAAANISKKMGSTFYK